MVGHKPIHVHTHTHTHTTHQHGESQHLLRVILQPRPDWEDQHSRQICILANPALPRLVSDHGSLPTSCCHDKAVGPIRYRHFTLHCANQHRPYYQVASRAGNALEGGHHIRPMASLGPLSHTPFKSGYHQLSGPAMGFVLGVDIGVATSQHLQPPTFQGVSPSFYRPLYLKDSLLPTWSPFRGQKGASKSEI